MLETNFEKAKKWKGCVYVGSDLMMLDQLTNASFPTDSRRMNFILIGLCTKGTVRFRMDTQLQELKAGCMVVISEHHVIDGYEASPDLEGLCFMMSMAFYNEVIHNVSDVSALFLFAHNHPIFPLSERDQKVFNDYFYVIKKKICEEGNRFRRDLVRTLMLAMFYDLSNLVYHFQQSSSHRQTRADVIFTQFIHMVEEHCKHERRVSWYAKQLSITPKYLSEMVKHVSKRTPNEWIDNYVTLELRIMLKNSTKNIKTIAKEMNFPNQSFLGKYFKEHVGMSPSDYRKS